MAADTLITLDGVALRFEGSILVGGRCNDRAFNVLGTKTRDGDSLRRPRSAISLIDRGLAAGQAHSIKTAVDWVRSGG
jgi:hypothetical protein